MSALNQSEFLVYKGLASPPVPCSSQRRCRRRNLVIKRFLHRYGDGQQHNPDRKVDQLRPEALTVFEDVSIYGSIDADRDVVVAGRVEGQLHCRDATITASGTVIGDVIARKVVVSGIVDGNIFANNVVLHPNCQVFGDMYHEKLQLHEGCYFEGRSRNTKNPQALANR